MAIIYPLLHVQCVVCSYYPFVHILRNNILYCVQECAGFRDIKHNFRYHCVPLFIYRCLRFASIISVIVSIRTCFECDLCSFAQSLCSHLTCARRPGPCTLPSPFTSSIEPRGMHQRGAPPCSLSVAAGLQLEKTMVISLSQTAR